MDLSPFIIEQVEVERWLQLNLQTMSGQHLLSGPNRSSKIENRTATRNSKANIDGKKSTQILPLFFVSGGSNV